jgi:Fe-S oxidoreductase
MVGLEPSCTTLFRDDLPELLPDDDRAARVARATRTLAELLETEAPEWSPPNRPAAVTVQPHCHQHATTGTGAERRLMARYGAGITVLDAGCCGLAGNFGFERAHADVSRRVAETGVLPAVRDADPGSTVVADGFSCRTQIEQLAAGRPRHLAEVLRDALGEAS